jgi:hypothetical protein
MRRSSGRGQVEPTAALVAVFAVCVGLSLYAGVANDFASHRGLSASSSGPDETARQAADAVADASRTSGVIVPDRLPSALDAGPSGLRLNATLSTADRRWRAGPTPPPRSAVARLRVTTVVGPGDVDPATLRVEVWR